MVVALPGYKAGEGLTSADFIPSPTELQPPPTAPGAKPGLKPSPAFDAMHDFIPSPREAPLPPPLLASILLPPWSPLERDEVRWRGKLAR